MIGPDMIPPLEAGRDDDFLDKIENKKAKVERLPCGIEITPEHFDHCQAHRQAIIDSALDELLPDTTATRPPAPEVNLSLHLTDWRAGTYGGWVRYWKGDSESVAAKADHEGWSTFRLADGECLGRGHEAWEEGKKLADAALIEWLLGLTMRLDRKLS